MLICIYELVVMDYCGEEALSPCVSWLCPCLALYGVLLNLRLLTGSNSFLFET